MITDLILLEADPEQISVLPVSVAPVIEVPIEMVTLSDTALHGPKGLLVVSVKVTV